jgi:hypothetical protein
MVGEDARMRGSGLLGVVVIQGEETKRGRGEEAKRRGDEVYLVTPTTNHQPPTI